MSINVQARTTCRLCDSLDLQLALELPPSALADDYLPAEKADRSRERYPLNVMLCSSCGQSQLEHVASAEAIYGDYIYRTASSPGLDVHFESYASDVFKVIQLKPSAKVLDLGCNDGALLRSFQKRGAKVVGVEPATQIAEALSASGIPTINDYFTEASAQRVEQAHGLFDVITANNVFANVDDVRNFALGARSLLNERGVFIIETGYASSLIENSVFDNIYHEHLSYFSVAPLEKFFNSLDMEIIHVQEVPTKGGSLRAYIQKKNGPHSRNSVVSELIRRESDGGLFDGSAYKRLEERIQKVKTESRSLIQSLKNEGKKLCGYGASATCTTMIHTLELGSDLEFLVDDNPIKENTLSPGFHLPVYSSKYLVEEGNRADVALILPWRFRDQIVERSSKFTSQGGKFMTLLPECQILS